MTNISSIQSTNVIKCPHCGTRFTIDEAQYADIAQQVRTAEFDSELHARLADAETSKQAEIALALAKPRSTDEPSAGGVGLIGVG